jgi:hypothetical protein
MKASGQVECKEYIQATLLHYKSNTSTVLLFYMITIFFGFAGISGLILSITQDYPIQYFLPILCIALIPSLIRFVIIPLQITNTYRAQKEWQSPVDYEITETHLLQNSLYNKSSIPLTKIVRLRENKGLSLIYYNLNCFYIIPKCFFTDPNQIVELRTMLPGKNSTKAIALQKPVRNFKLIIYGALFVIIVFLILKNLYF